MIARQQRPYQAQAFWFRKKVRRYLLSWLRQGGKTTTLADQSLQEMMEVPGRLVTFASASLGIGGEMIEKEAKSWGELMAGLRDLASKQNMRLVGVETRDDRGDAAKELPADLPWSDLAGIMERNRFELKLWHSNSVCSRTKVIAANLSTCRGWSGSVKLDEAAFVRDLSVLLAEIEPFVSTDPTFNLIMATTPPDDYGHFAYELMAEENGVEEWEVKPEGNWYRNRMGLWVHRVTVDDAYAAGRKCYDADTGAEQTPDENRAISLNREGWDRSNRLLRPKVGTSMVSPMAVDAAMQRGRHGLAVAGDLASGDLEKVVSQIGDGKITVGVDLATTTSKKSNPTALAICERRGMVYHFPLVWWWKTSNPEETQQKLQQILQALKAAGKNVRGTGVDASNERFFSTNLRTRMRSLRLGFVHLILKGSRTNYRGEDITVQSYLGNLTANAFEDGQVAIPQNRYLSDDIARKKKDGSGFSANVGPNGEHADTLDAIEIALSLQAKGAGSAQAEALPVGEVCQSMNAGGNRFRSGLKNPLLRKVRSLFKFNS